MMRAITLVLLPALLQVEQEAPPETWRDMIPPAVRPWLVPAAIGLVALLVLRGILRRVGRAIRRRRGPVIHPKLQKYNVDHARLDRERRKLATGIVATSTGTRLAGFQIAQQVEAVFVEGHRTPDEALIALKAAAAERGANALLNVRAERTVAGKCAASGDAVIAKPVVPKATPPPVPPHARQRRPGAADGDTPASD